MSIRAGVRRFFRLALRRGDLAADDVAREIDFHLHERVRQLEASGMRPEEARAEAQRRFGDVDAARAELSALRNSNSWSASRRSALISTRECYRRALKN